MSASAVEPQGVQEDRTMIEPESPRRAALLRYALFAALGVGLLGAIATHSLVAALLEIAPSRAASIRPDDPAVLMSSVERTIGELRAHAEADARREGASAPGRQGNVEWRRQQADDLRRRVSAVLAQEPGNARALAILGGLAREVGEIEAAATLFDASVRRSMREPAALGWLIDEAMKRRDWQRAVQYAARMLDFHNDALEPLAPLIAQLLEHPDGLIAVRDVLAPAPEWRPHIFWRLFDAAVDARRPLELLLALKETPNPPTMRELRQYMDFLIDRQFFDLAYYSWLQFLSPDALARVGPLFNGSFEATPAGLPFDWEIASEGATRAAIERRPDRRGEQALVIRFGEGRAALGDVTQLVRLMPGSYQVEGSVRGELRGQRGMRWRVHCFGEAMPPLGESAMLGGRIETWTDFSFTVTVPETGCRMQQVRLLLDARTPSEQIVSGTIWFDELSMRRLP